MKKPTPCTCGGAYKKATSPGDRRDGSRYFKCERCGARIEQTAEGYELHDAATVVPAAVVAPVAAPVAAPTPPPRPWW